MKYKVTRKELNECIAEAVAKVIKEDLNWDEIGAIVNNASKDKKAAKFAQKDADKEAAAAAADDAKIAGQEAAEMDTSDDDSSTCDVDPKNLPYEELFSPKNARQGRAFKTELLRRERIKKEFEEDGIKPEWGYQIDANGNVQPTHTDLGGKNTGAWDGRSGDFSGLNFGWGHSNANGD